MVALFKTHPHKGNHENNEHCGNKNESEVFTRRDSGRGAFL